MTPVKPSAIASQTTDQIADSLTVTSRLPRANTNRSTTSITTTAAPRMPQAAIDGSTEASPVDPAAARTGISDSFSVRVEKVSLACLGRRCRASIGRDRLDEHRPSELLPFDGED